MRAKLALVGLVVLTASISVSSSRPVGAGADELRLPPPSFPAVNAIEDPKQALAAIDREIARLGSAVPSEALVLRAHLLSAAGRPRDAAAVWDEIARGNSDLSAFASRSTIAALIAAREPDEALPRVQAVVGPRPAADDDLLLVSLGDAYQVARQFERAAQIYRDVVGRQRQTALGDRARLGLAASEEAAGHLEAAMSAWHDATIAWRMPATFASARAGEARVAARLGREPVALEAENYFAIADRLTAASHYDDAVALLEEGKRTGRLADDERFEAAVIDSLYRGRRNEAARARADQFLSRFPASDKAADIRLTQLRIDVRLDRLASARKRLVALERDRRAADAWQSGAVLIAAQLAATGAPRDGLALYRRVLARTLPRGDRFDVSWRAGMAAVRLGDNKSAVALFTQARKYALTRPSPRSTLYWLAVALQRRGDTGQSNRLLTDLVDENAFDYYGLRAAERLRRAVVLTATDAGLEFPSLEIGQEASTSPEFRTAMVLAKAGLTSDAASLLNTLARRVRDDAALALLAGRAAYAADDFATAWTLVSTRFAPYLERPATGVPEDVRQMAFPRAYWEQVNPAATKAGVDPLLMLSLMRRESRFVVSAQSRTGAIGLFQIMPYTAKELAGAGQPGQGETPLDAPASADLAASLVRRIEDKFGNAVAPVVASYNAGEDRVDAWWRAARGVPEDVFVDSIPFGETRLYVREVLANYVTYKKLYGK